MIVEAETNGGIKKINFYRKVVTGGKWLLAIATVYNDEVTVKFPGTSNLEEIKEIVNELKKHERRKKS